MTRRVTVRAKRPSFQRERTLGGRVAGVDEAGRGPLAGPVVAAAVIFGSAMVQRGLPRALMPLIDDSKKLSAQDREAALVALRQLPGTEIGIGAASVGEIGQLNILHATMLAMRRAVARLREPPEAALIDGDRIPAGMICPAESVVGGDALCLSIAAASIVAKVVRDRAMARLAVRHHGYGWERNAGYATLAHRDALHLFGPTRHHRATFGTVRQLSLDLGLIAPCVLVPG